jgi:hypothetical protein
MSIWGPVAVSVLLTYMISSLFLGIFENAVLALMTCLSVDMDLNGADDTKWGPRTFHDKIAAMKAAHKVEGESDDDEQKANPVK